MISTLPRRRDGLRLASSLVLWLALGAAPASAQTFLSLESAVAEAGSLMYKDAVVRMETVFGVPGLPIDSFGGVMDVTEYDHIDVWRVLHGQRDIPAWMQVPDDVI